MSRHGARGDGRLGGDPSRPAGPRQAPSAGEQTRHDVRNALGTVLAGLRLLDATELSSKGRSILEGTREAAETLTVLAERLMAASPEAGAEPSPRSAPADPKALPDLSGARILVADDVATFRHTMVAMLTQLGAICVEAADGTEAAARLAGERFDLALLDRRMPGLGGDAVVRGDRRRHARDGTPPVPLVLVSGDLDETVDGVAATIVKPLPPLPTFAAVIDRVLRAAGRAEPAPLDVAALRDLLALAGATEAGTVTAQLNADLADVQGALERALPADDRDELRRQAHVLISLAGTLGAASTLRAARRLQDAARGGGSASGVAEAGLTCLSRVDRLRMELRAMG